jgi:5-(carboxyamino)imidazole ribonucleotide mutase
MKAVIIMGSKSDHEFAQRIIDELEKYSISYDLNIASAHKQPLEVLNIIKSNNAESGVVYVTIAGRSNALSGFVAANSSSPVIACPPFKDKTDMLVNIHSTLQMPSNAPVLTILDPDNCALAVKRIMELV